jgi:hypothetical protein
MTFVFGEMSFSFLKDPLKALRNQIVEGNKAFVKSNLHLVKRDKKFNTCWFILLIEPNKLIKAYESDSLISLRLFTNLNIML